jgi:hypothetical protein
MQSGIDSLESGWPGRLGSTLLAEGGQAVSRDRLSGEYVVRSSGIDSPGRRWPGSQGWTLFGGDDQVGRDRQAEEKVDR